MWITNGAVNDTETGDVVLVYARTAEGGGAGKVFAKHLGDDYLSAIASPAGCLVVDVVTLCVSDAALAVLGGEGHARIQRWPAHQGL